MSKRKRTDDVVYSFNKNLFAIPYNNFFNALAETIVINYDELESSVRQYMLNHQEQILTYLLNIDFTHYTMSHTDREDLRVITPIIPYHVLMQAAANTLEATIHIIDIANSCTITIAPNGRSINEDIDIINIDINQPYDLYLSVSQYNNENIDQELSTSTSSKANSTATSAEAQSLMGDDGFDLYDIQHHIS
jgi:hypothetical protein